MPFGGWLVVVDTVEIRGREVEGKRSGQGLVEVGGSRGWQPASKQARDRTTERKPRKMETKLAKKKKEVEGLAGAS